MKEQLKSFSAEATANNLMEKFGEATDKNLGEIKKEISGLGIMDRDDVVELLKNKPGSENLTSLIEKAIDELRDDEFNEQTASADQERQEELLERNTPID